MTTPERPVGTDELVPVSVSVGQVVPPDDPEVWTRPLTWIAAMGMLGAPLLALAWLVAAPPADAAAPLPGTWLLAATLVAGAAAAGATQIGRLRAFAGTVAAGLLAGLLVVMVGVVLAGDRQVGSASPPVAHAVAGALSGLTGSLAGASVAAVVAIGRSRLVRWLAPTVVGVAVAAAAIRLLFGA